jgi:Uma2 family endonuclease
MYQTDPPLSPKETLPTMYDLPSEAPEEAGLPDQFHLLQPQLLTDSFQPQNYSVEEIFTGSDINLYYDVRHTLWYKRPDWFAALGVPNLYENRDLRLSYVVWQEGVNPYIVVELLSPGTEKEDLGKSLRDVEKPPTKWEVYEQILRVPYYAIFDRYKSEFKMFQLNGTSYSQVNLSDNRFWIPDIELGLGVWIGNYKGVEMPWLRWYDTEGNWVLTGEEQKAKLLEEEKIKLNQTTQQLEEERLKTEKLLAQLKSLGIEPDL